MRSPVQMLVLDELLTGRFEEEIVDDADVEWPGGDFAKKLTEPAVVSRAAGVCRAWHDKVKARRAAVLLEAVGGYVHYCMLGGALYLADIDMYGVISAGGAPAEVPPETRLRIAVRLGEREMYAVEAVRRTRDELVLQASVCSWADAPPRAYMPHGVALHRLCWVHEDLRAPAEQEELDDWHATASARLGLLLEHWRNVATCRLR